MRPVTFSLPIHLRSVANLREHWRVKAKHAKAERHVAGLAARALLPREIGWPIVVTITRVAPRSLDGDNLQAAAKAIRDGIADALGLKSDSDPRVTWVYGQAQGKPCHVRVEIKCGSTAFVV